MAFRMSGKIGAFSTELILQGENKDNGMKGKRNDGREWDESSK